MGSVGSKEYLKNQVMTASPEQLQMMLYDGAIRYARLGKEAIQAGDIEQSFNHLTRAQRIVLEMINGLRPEVNPELCERMAALYNFIYRKLVDATIHKETGSIDEALRILDYQRETWAMLIKKIDEERRQEAKGTVRDAPETKPDPEQRSLSVEG